ncbi:DEHA2A01188p [Debaryomyces hansenii CBS767]|uniref:DEHA2A01188p n=1 Tax=Debaryomyces hansenii (strain ATCC 36239 / CBS 767 / BCRC 21394 / JCM 1990 / NBRC 0083 / IGC 2968) TaxID=284592 RepID=B5RSN7_DEBHA|nr:DEHA2A01188p [Debaryomyces hansenii CBS767]CAR65343.1 DEHA2A01188p [Debaryomyces hansenii CBS767]|eukprot:XP_002769950.1 DEHA2A01188p [Debaryomyces hansenii CBS767]
MLFSDEPTTGLDIKALQVLRKFISTIWNHDYLIYSSISTGNHCII